MGNIAPRRPVSAVRGRPRVPAGSKPSARWPSRSGPRWCARPHGRRNDQVASKCLLRTLGAGPTRSSRRVANRAFRVRSSSSTRGAPAGPSRRSRRLLRDARTVGRHHAAQGNAHLRGRHSGRRPGCCRKTLHESASPPERACHRLEAGIPATLDGARPPVLDHRAAGNAAGPSASTRHPHGRHGDRDQGRVAFAGAGRRGPDDGPTGNSRSWCSPAGSRDKDTR